MNSVKKLNELADKFAMKISRAQTTGAQAGDIENALKSAGQWVTPDQISPLLATAKVPDTATIDISIAVDKNLNIKFQVTANPSGPYATVLAKLLSNKFGPGMTAALKKANLQVAGITTARLANFS